MILSLLTAIGLAALGIGAFLWFRHLESQGGDIRTHVLIILAYRALGASGVLGLFMVLAAGASVNAFLRYSKLNKLKNESP